MDNAIEEEDSNLVQEKTDNSDFVNPPTNSNTQKRKLEKPCLSPFGFHQEPMTPYLGAFQFPALMTLNPCSYSQRFVSKFFFCFVKCMNCIVQYPVHMGG